MPGSQPNIVFICTDQQRFDSLGCYGNEMAITPHIDQLAEEGVLFEQCYVQSPVCSPSRASLLTGKYVHNHGLWSNGVALPSHHPLFTKALADAGYDCGLVGKWHLAACYGGRTEPRLDDGFRVFEWAHDPTHGSQENAYHRWLEENHHELWERAVANGPGRPAHEPVLFDTMPTETHYSHWVGERSIEFLRDERHNEEPFFLWVNFFDPHHPFVAPQEYMDRFDRDTLPSPIGSADDLSKEPAVLWEAHLKSYAGAARGFAEYSPEEIRDVLVANYAMVSLIDDEVGRILSTLEELGMTEDTLVIFTSDHGEMQGDHGILLKGPMMYEGAVHTPLVMRWPVALPKARRVESLVEWIDLNSTLMEASGLPPIPGDQGQSLLPLARGDADASKRGWAICEYRDSGHPYEPPVHTTMLREGDYKLIVFHGNPATDRVRDGQLYDLAIDPNEMNNLWHDEAYLLVRMRMQEHLLDILVATEDRSAPREAYW